MLTKLKILLFLFLFVFVLAINLLFFFFGSDIESFGNYQFEYVYDKGWPANYILVMKDGNEGNFDKIISGLVLEYYKEDDNIYFSYIDGQGFASDSCYYKPEILYGKIILNKNHIININSMEKNNFLSEDKIMKGTRNWLADPKNKCNIQTLD
ncbi:TPA: hypothetical protein ACT4GT_001647 [Neisseria meningitidis]